VAVAVQNAAAGAGGFNEDGAIRRLIKKTKLGLAPEVHAK